MSTKALNVANWFIARANKEKVDESTSEGITNLKLQKMLYFAQAAHLSLNNGAPLFEEDIHAWQYGPVVGSLYGTFKPRGRKSPNTPIAAPTNDEYLNLDDETKEFLEDTWTVFGKYSASKLVKMSHEHRPWLDTYREGEKRIIPIELIGDYYKNAFRRV